MNRFAAFIATIACATVTPSLMAGPEWIEGTLGSAGDRVETAQPTGGGGLLAKITGGLGGGLLNGSQANYQDMFIIRIVNPAQFSATTVPANGHAEFDSQLWLFTIDGHGLLGNDDTFITEDGKTGCLHPGSTLTNQANDGTNQGIPGPGLYLLAISSTGTVPANENGPIFNLANVGEVSGPDGTGGQSPISLWNLTGQQPELGDYGIYVTGTGMSGLFLDIKPGGCPNSHNVDSLGVLPVSVCGTGGFNPLLINPATIVLARADGVGGAVPLLEASAQFGDEATPFAGESCNCHEVKGDGTDDLNVKFSSPAMRKALMLDKVPGDTLLPLEVRGEFVNGTPFVASDCIRIVPPGLLTP